MIKEIDIELISVFAEALEMRVPCMMGHSMEVSNLAMEVAKLLRKSDEEIKLFGIAGLLHDVGKIGVPEAILQKPHSLNEKEWMIIKKHPVLSAEIIKPISDLKDVTKWVFYHHKWWDGSGYPARLKGKNIPMGQEFWQCVMHIPQLLATVLTEKSYR